MLIIDSIRKKNQTVRIIEPVCITGTYEYLKEKLRAYFPNIYTVEIGQKSYQQYQETDSTRKRCT